MSEHQQRDDHSSTCSDFEPIFGVPQTEEQLDVEVEPNVYNKEDDEQQTGNENDDEGGRSSATGDLNSSQQSVQQHIAAAEGNNMNLMTMLHLQLKLANAEKEKAELKAEMVGKMQANMQKEVEQSEADKAANEEHGRMMEKKVSELSFGLTELRDQLHNLKATVLEDTKQQISLKLKNATTPVHIALRSFKVDMEQRLELLEKGSSVECLRNLLEEDRLKEWLVTGAGQLRNVTLLRDISQQLVTSSYWNIQPGGLKANKTGSIWTSVRAIHPHSVANASPDGKPLFYFEVSVTGATDDSYVYIGLCDCNFDFTSQSTYVGNVAGSFAMRKDGTFLASGTEQSGFGKGAFANGDVVGCGLLVLPAERRLFYTKNGEIWVKPILLGPEDAKDNLRPIVSAYDSSTQVEFNFGADFAAKPFKYELTQLNVADG